MRGTFGLIIGSLVLGIIATRMNITDDVVFLGIALLWTGYTASGE